MRLHNILLWTQTMYIAPFARYSASSLTPYARNWILTGYCLTCFSSILGQPTHHVSIIKPILAIVWQFNTRVSHANGFSPVAAYLAAAASLLILPTT